MLPQVWEELEGGQWASAKCARGSTEREMIWLGTHSQRGRQGHTWVSPSSPAVAVMSHVLEMSSEEVLPTSLPCHVPDPLPNALSSSFSLFKLLHILRHSLPSPKPCASLCL